jgi:hypothetical protein
MKKFITSNFRNRGHSKNTTNWVVWLFLGYEMVKIGRKRKYKAGATALLHVKPEMHHISILYQVFLAFNF